MLMLGQGLGRKERESCSRGEDSGMPQVENCYYLINRRKEAGGRDMHRGTGWASEGTCPLGNFTQEQPCLFVHACQECLRCLTLGLASVLFVQVCYSHCKLGSRDGRTRYNQKANPGVPCTQMVRSTLRDTLLSALWFNHTIVCFMVWISKFSNILTPTPRTRRNHLDGSKDF